MHLLPLVEVIHSNVKWKPHQQSLHKFLPVLRLHVFCKKMNNFLALFLSLTEY